MNYFFLLSLSATLRSFFSTFLFFNSCLVAGLTLSQNDSVKNSGTTRKLSFIEKLIYSSIALQFFLLLGLLLLVNI